MCHNVSWLYKCPVSAPRSPVVPNLASNAGLDWVGTTSGSRAENSFAVERSSEGLFDCQKFFNKQAAHGTLHFNDSLYWSAFDNSTWGGGPNSEASLQQMSPHYPSPITEGECGASSQSQLSSAAALTYSYNEEYDLSLQAHTELVWESHGGLLDIQPQAGPATSPGNFDESDNAALTSDVLIDASYLLSDVPTALPELSTEEDEAPELQTQDRNRWKGKEREDCYDGQKSLHEQGSRWKGKGRVYDGGEDSQSQPEHQPQRDTTDVSNVPVLNHAQPHASDFDGTNDYPLAFDSPLPNQPPTSHFPIQLTSYEAAMFDLTSSELHIFLDMLNGMCSEPSAPAGPLQSTGRHQIAERRRYSEDNKLAAPPQKRGHYDDENVVPYPVAVDNGFQLPAQGQLEYEDANDMYNGPVTFPPPQCSLPAPVPVVAPVAAPVHVNAQAGSSNNQLPTITATPAGAGAAQNIGAESAPQMLPDNHPNQLKPLGKQVRTQYLYQTMNDWRILHSDGVYCEWIIASGQVCQEFKMNGELLREHCRAVHGVTASKAASGEKVQCRWDGCGQEMDKGGLDRHIHEVHLRRKRRGRGHN
ncbi:hypothetical protein D9619_013068 [Psilocybe cf. subviscida]|uniref:Uncharacterized protein n=1 Tax=Psilocybe cf. subviscida TaxID=2480587 RepID=A0A8H5AZJ7_9AGAR|nr:hypothetical protein D9619_013068 [Psilocybe cf. subviscida]